MRRTILSLSVALLLVPGVARATAYSIQYVYVPGSIDTYLTSINDLGQVVGFSVGQPFGVQSGLVVSGGVVSTFNVPGADQTRLGGINDSGQIVGQYYNTYSGPISGFIESNGVITAIRPPGLDSPLLTGINNAGDVVGSNAGYDAFVIRNGQVTVFTNLYGYTYAINDSGVTAGTVTVNGKDKGFIYDGTFKIIDYPGAVTTDFGAINNLGQVVGYAAFGSGIYGGPTSLVSFIYANGAFTTFDPKLPGSVVAMNDNGVIIGEVYDSTIRVPLDTGGYYLGAQLGFIATPTSDPPVSTPEPATIAVLGTAMVGWAARRRDVLRRWTAFRQ